MAEMSKRQLAEEWLKYALENWKSNITKMRVHETGYLFNSFKSQVIEQAGGDKLKITIAYAWYGQMVDMGVGRGVRSGEQKDTATMRRILGKKAGADRKPKRWYSKGKPSMGFQTMRLATLLAANKANESVKKISGAIEHQHTIRIV